MAEYETILFDCDGVLVEPPERETQAAATRAAFAAVGVEDADRQHVIDVVDGVTVDRLHEICTAYDLNASVFWEARERHDERSQLGAFRAGTRKRYDDVTALTNLTQKCGIVSNNHHSTIEFVLDFFELRPLFDTHYGREKAIVSLRRKKPNTHYLDRALADLGAESALYVGDSENDVITAHRAGMDSVFVRRAHCRSLNISTVPTHEVDSLHSVPAIADGRAMS